MHINFVFAYIRQYEKTGNYVDISRDYRRFYKYIMYVVEDYDILQGKIGVCCFKVRVIRYRVLVMKSRRKNTF